MTIDVNNASDAPQNKDIDVAQGNQWQFLTEFTSSAILVIQDQKIMYTNPAAETLTGFTKKELLGINFFELFTGNDKNKIREWGTLAIQGESSNSQGEYKIVTKYGDERWIDLTTSPVTLNNEQAVICNFFDVTEHKRGEVLQEAV